MKNFIFAVLLTSTVMVNQGYAMELENDDSPSYVAQSIDSSIERVKALSTQMVTEHPELSKVYHLPTANKQEHLSNLSNDVRQVISKSIDTFMQKLGLNVQSIRDEINFYNGYIKTLGEQEDEGTAETIENLKKSIAKEETPLFFFGEDLQSIQNLIKQLDEESQL